MCSRPRGQPHHHRHAELQAEFINHLGGEHCITPWERRDIARAATLQTVSEIVSRELSGSLEAMQLEELARDAVESLRLVCHRGYHPREELAA